MTIEIYQAARLDLDGFCRCEIGRQGDRPIDNDLGDGRVRFGGLPLGKTGNGACRSDIDGPMKLGITIHNRAAINFQCCSGTGCTDTDITTRIDVQPNTATCSAQLGRPGDIQSGTRRSGANADRAVIVIKVRAGNAPLGRDFVVKGRPVATGEQSARGAAGGCDIDIGVCADYRSGAARDGKPWRGSDQVAKSERVLFVVEGIEFIGGEESGLSSAGRSDIDGDSGPQNGTASAGDRIWGNGIPVGDYVTSATSTALTLSIAATGTYPVDFLHDAVPIETGSLEASDISDLQPPTSFLFPGTRVNNYAYTSDNPPGWVWDYTNQAWKAEPNL